MDSSFDSEPINRPTQIVICSMVQAILDNSVGPSHVTPEDVLELPTSTVPVEGQHEHLAKKGVAPEGVDHYARFAAVLDEVN